VRVLLDECVPKRLGRFLSDHDVLTTPQAGWDGITNGELLRLAAEDFDVFVTVDRNLAFQQNPSNLPLPVIVIHSRSNKLSDMQPHVPALRQTLSSVLTSQVYHIGALRLVDSSSG
jgi:predicted nuclease of predicted toxin-antitoxin system